MAAPRTIAESARWIVYEFPHVREPRGAFIRRKLDGREAYAQPSLAADLRSALTALDVEFDAKEDQRMKDHCFNVLCAEHFDASR